MRYNERSTFRSLIVTAFLFFFVVSVIFGENPWIRDQGQPTLPTPPPSVSCAAGAGPQVNGGTQSISSTYFSITFISQIIVNGIITYVYPTSR